VTLRQGLFNMTSASHLFRKHEQLDVMGAELVGNEFQLDGNRYLPLYEGKMVHHYDHRFATYERDGETIRDTSEEEKQQPDYAPLPRYWVEEREVLLRTADLPRAVRSSLQSADKEKLEEALRAWLAGQLLLRQRWHEAGELLGSRIVASGESGSLFDTVELSAQGQTAQSLAQEHVMTDAELDDWLTAFNAG